jgi:hypothetical protein
MAVGNEDDDSTFVNLDIKACAWNERVSVEIRVGEFEGEDESCGIRGAVRVHTGVGTNSSALRKARIESEDDSEAAASSSHTIDFLKDVLAAELHIMLVPSVCSRGG